MRKAEITLLTVLFTIIGSIASMYIEKEYGVTITIEKTLESNSTQEPKQKEIIFTDK